MLYDTICQSYLALYRAKQAEGFNWAAWIDIHKVNPQYPADKIGFTPVSSYTGNLFTVT